MPNDISASGWLVILCALALGFGLVRFLVVTMNQELERKADQEEAGEEHAANEETSKRASKQARQDPPPDSPRPNDEHAHWTEVLELAAQASAEDIRAAYRRKMAQYHPDKVATLGPELRRLAEQMAKRINRAYEEALLERK